MADPKKRKPRKSSAVEVSIAASPEMIRLAEALESASVDALITPEPAWLAAFADHLELLDSSVHLDAGQAAEWSRIGELIKATEESERRFLEDAVPGSGDDHVVALHAFSTTPIPFGLGLTSAEFWDLTYREWRARALVWAARQNDPTLARHLLSPDAGIRGVASTSENRSRIESYLKRASECAGRRITKKMFWSARGYRDSTAFESFQRNDPNPNKNTVEARRNFEAQLAEPIPKFLKHLRDKRLIT